MERDKNRVGYCTLVLAASGWIIIGAAITYLELKRNAEINPLAATVNYLIKEVDGLRAEIESMKNSSNYRFEQLEKRNDSPVPPASSDYYDDRFDDEYDEDLADEEAASDDKEGTNAGRQRRSSGSSKSKYSGKSDELRGRRSLFGSSPVIVGSSPNAIIRQSWSKPGNLSRGVEAEIIVDTLLPQEKPGDEVIQFGGNCCKPVAAHFEGDVSSVTHAKTQQYQGTAKGNHRTYQSGVITEWEPASWMRTLNLTPKFGLDAGRSGVSIKEESQGVYFVYAQVFYADPHDTAGFGIFVNHENVFQCTVTSLHQPETHRHRAKTNSCYTGGLVRLSTGDKVTLREIEGTRSTVMFAPKSFMGMFRVYSL